jgi:hypothetical protein
VSRLNPDRASRRDARFGLDAVVAGHLGVPVVMLSGDEVACAERVPRGNWYEWCMHDETARSAIDTFVSAFNASDDGYVTGLLSQALTSDVVFWGPLGRSEGIEAVERFVLDIRRHPAGTGTMVRCSAVDMPDEWARYQWVFTTPDGGPRLAGTDVVHLRRSLIDQIIVFAGEIEPSAS